MNHNRDPADILKDAAKEALASIASVNAGRENLFRDAFVGAVNSGGGQGSIQARSTTNLEEAQTGADDILQWPSSRSLDQCYLQLKIVYKSYSEYCKIMKAKNSFWEPDNVSHMSVAEPYFDAKYRSTRPGYDEYQAVTMSDTVKAKNEGKEVPIAAGGFLLIEENNVSVLRLGAFGAMLSPWVEVTRKGISELSGSKLNEIMKERQPIGMVLRWPQDEENTKALLIDNK